MAQLPLDQSIPRFKENEERVDKFVNGESDETWQSSGGSTLPTIARLIAQTQQLSTRVYYTTKVLMDAAGNDPAQIEDREKLALVTDDPDPENNGFWRWDTTLNARVKTNYQVVDPDMFERMMNDLVNEITIRLQGKMDKYLFDHPEMLGGILDASGNETWVGIEKTKGYPSKWAEKILREVLGIHIASAGNLLGGFIDDKGNFSDLVVDRTTGQVLEFAIKRWAARIAPYLNLQSDIFVPPNADAYKQYKTSTTEITLGDYRINNRGDVVPMLPNMTLLATWGSSSMQYSAPFYQALATQLGMTYFSSGQSGTGSRHAACRLGAMPTYLTFTNNVILASGTSSCSTTGFGAHPNQQFTGTINGVHGRLYFSSGAKFDRTNPGEEVAVEPNTLFVPDMGDIHRNGVNFLWVGRNSIGADPATVQPVVDDTNVMFNFMAPEIKRCLVMGHMIGQAQVHDVTWDNIIAVNEALRKRYQNLYIDVMAYLCSPEVWTHTGISPTPEDEANQAAGRTPPSLARTPTDQLHLSDVAYQAIADHPMKDKMLELQWITEVVEPDPV